MRPKAEWAIDSEAIRTRGIRIILSVCLSIKKKIITILLIEVLVKNMMILVALKKGKGEEMY